MNDKNIDFNETVEFVWDWIAQLNAHLLSHNWGTIGAAVHQRGLATSNLQSLSSELLKMIFASEDPQRFMNAMSRQIQSFQTITNFPQLPRSYVKIIQDEEGTESSRWNLEVFTQALHTDITRIVEAYKVIENEANVQYAASTKKQKM